MMKYCIKYLVLFSGFIQLSIIYPAISYSQAADEPFVYGDPLPDAPDLAYRGDYKVGVRTIEIVHNDQIDILKARDGIEPHYDRKLKLEIWYPALIPDDLKEKVNYIDSRGVPDNPEYLSSRDSHIKAIVVFAPWGMERGAWDSESLKGLTVPSFFVAGSMDDVSGYEKGTKAIFTGAVNSDRYLLTYVNARHNVAPNPPPKESLKPGFPFDFYYHYAEPAWDQRRMNNINQHFVTAFMGIHLKKMEYAKYFEAAENKDIRTWPGFKNRTSVGLELLYSSSLTQ